MKIPTVSVAEMRDVDKKAVNFFGLEVLQMMENAGRNTAAFARDRLKGVKNKTIVVLAGKGHNGGDGMVAARFLQNWGAKVTVIIPDHPDDLSKTTREQAGIIRSMFVNRAFSTDKITYAQHVKDAHLIIDALLGYNINGDPRGLYAEIINLANNSKNKILAIDVPSGLNPDTGEAFNPCIKANWTLGLILPKQGCVEKIAKPYAGENWVTDMGVPNEIFQLMDKEVPEIFKDKDTIKY